MSPGRNVHIDTCFVQGFVIGENSLVYEDAEVLFKDNLYSLVGSEIQIKISQLAIGELINNFNENYLKTDSSNTPPSHRDQLGTSGQESIMSRLKRLIERYKVEITYPTEMCYKVFFDLKERMERLNDNEDNDGILVSQALCDSDSSYFLTTDETLLRSREIEKKAREMLNEEKRNRRIKISSEYG